VVISTSGDEDKTAVSHAAIAGDLKQDRFAIQPVVRPDVQDSPAREAEAERAKADTASPSN
jgi:hypothetical protein